MLALDLSIGSDSFSHMFPFMDTEEYMTLSMQDL
jgi:hypothetical protein